jgi:hypothetical protein
MGVGKKEGARVSQRVQHHVPRLAVRQLTTQLHLSVPEIVPTGRNHQRQHRKSGLPSAHTCVDNAFLAKDGGKLSLLSRVQRRQRRQSGREDPSACT